MDWDELGLSGVTGGHQYELLGWTGLNWDELGWTGMDWDGHRSHCGASELSEVAPGGLWVILGWTGMNWNHTRAPVWVTGMNWDELG